MRRSVRSVLRIDSGRLTMRTPWRSHADRRLTISSFMHITKSSGGIPEASSVAGNSSGDLSSTSKPLSASFPAVARRISASSFSRCGECASSR